MPAATDTSIPVSPPLATAPLSPENLDKLPRLVPRKRNAPPQNTLPVPETPRLTPPPDLSNWSFEGPYRQILSESDHETFLKSPTRDLIVSFVFSLSESVADKKVSTSTSFQRDPTIQKLHSILDLIEETIKSFPPVDQEGSRFGNPAFRDFFDAVTDNSPSWHARLGLKSESCISEVAAYLQESFGSRIRIDYGSGHELNFVIWLLCLNRLSILPPSLFPAVALIIFPRYIKIIRHVQSTYYLEPAGSIGVWGLDDYQFLPFLFGASQLLHHPYIRPLSIHNELVLDEEGDEYMYLDMIRFTMSSKTVKGLKWTQPMLDDISGAKSWEKVEQGMRRMFVKEILGKLVLMQHFLFGSLVPGPCSGPIEVKWSEQGQIDEHNDEHGHQHVHRDNAWGECCGIKIPSSVAAAQEAKKKGENGALRRIPFD